MCSKDYLYYPMYGIRVANQKERIDVNKICLEKSAFIADFIF